MAEGGGLPLDPMAEALRGVRGALDAAARASGRDPDGVTLVAVSKTVPAERLAGALALGLRVFGENRVQEAQAKWPALRERVAGVALHLIGHLQTNKAKDAVLLFDAIQSVDRPELAAALARAADRLGRRPAIFIQVNTGREPQKGGVDPDDADALIRACRAEFDLPVGGLMCIPPAGRDPAADFALLSGIAARNGLSGLSMGMSADFPAAIAAGATHVRVGSALFGARPPAAAPGASETGADRAETDR
ncbi:YggS family pyridoxal phosphate-dependent enzyme [Prosthecomicrobium pneumaticum]|uniref:Pyridoxal phosphate homeostasis protein n=1 Tax=Prosthecomicrobium pneumaticum TaxID=81895 RepID=A0A7W9FM04_9HYPH|nr:YggS family pyridoxal phosphate-dependent enzyme [Prosthecomicrobium pneumaticum]MBB5753133.1 hypothetical protein [Prosthecomicrobium pneumaticum]